MTREESLNGLLNRIPNNALIITSNGKLSRELFEVRKKRNEWENDFYAMGSMGCAIGIGIGVAMNTDKPVYVIIGDGALMMKLGSVADMLKNWGVNNLKIIVLNNECHASTGGQPTGFYTIRDFVEKHCEVIDVSSDARKDLGRPDISCEQITQRFHEKCINTNVG